MIKAEAITLIRSGKTLIDHLNVELHKEEITVLLGSNGSGKTSLMKLLLGLIEPTSGRVCYDGKDIASLGFKERSQKIAYVMQHPPRYGSLVAFDYILMGSFSQISAFRRPTTAQEDKVIALAKELAIEDLLRKKLSMLSGGELQLVHFAQALQQESPYLILDEPLSALDYQRQNEVRCHLMHILATKHLGALITLHDPNMAIKIAQRILIMDQGRLIADFSKEATTFHNQILVGLNRIFDGHMTSYPHPQGDLLLWSDDRL